MECDYCGESFDDEDAYLAHLHGDHEGELGAIDRRRVDEHVDDGGSGLPTGPLVLGAVVLAAVLVVVYVVVFVSGGDASLATEAGADGDAGAAGLAEVAQTPGPMGGAHEHGTIEVVIDGQRVDFSRQEYQLQADKFHFEGGVGQVWHKHAEGVTLEWAMATLDIGVSEDAVVFEETVYRDSDPGTNVTVTVNGEAVDPQSYVLQGVQSDSGDGGDRVRIVVETDESG
ncbi:MAG: hypothetical protein ABEH61_04935 [Haloarculaceae archaeon]